MIRVILSGAAGRMGRILARKIEESDAYALAGCVDPYGEAMAASLEDCTADADVVIDFSSHDGTEALLDTAVSRNLPVVLCTTGHTEEERAKIRAASEKIPVFYSSNMSLGVAILNRLVQQVAAQFSGDAEIVEIHHNRKKDAPSGTALSLAKSIQAARPNAEIVTGRSGMQPRGAGEIGIQSVRMGNIVGIHEVMFGTDTETITLKHEAHDRAVFADGALYAAEFLVGQPAGLYDMNDYLDAAGI